MLIRSLISNFRTFLTSYFGKHLSKKLYIVYTFFMSNFYQTFFYIIQFFIIKPINKISHHIIIII